MCSVRQGLLHCCETLEFTIGDKIALHRVERCMIYIYYIYIYIYIYIYDIHIYIWYIIIYRIYSRHKVILTWDLKPIPLDLCSDDCSTELASLTQEWSIQSMFTQEVTPKNTKLCQNVANWTGLTPPKLTLCLIYFHYGTKLF